MHVKAIIVNKKAGSFTDGRQLMRKLNKLGTVYEAEKPDELHALFDEVLQNKPDVVVFVGGDGTFIQGVEYFHKAGFRGAYAILPLGTSNYVARNLRIPLNTTQAIRRIERGQISHLPIAQSNGNYFMLYMAVGLSQKVAAHVKDKLKRRFGQAAYLYELIRQSRKSELFRYTITGNMLPEKISGESHQLLVYRSDLNVQVPIAPKHSIKTPTLKLVVAETGRSIFKLYFGWFLMVASIGLAHKYITVHEFTEAKITLEPQQSADLDGEVVSSGAYEVSISEETVQVIC